MESKNRNCQEVSALRDTHIDDITKHKMYQRQLGLCVDWILSSLGASLETLEEELLWSAFNDENKEINTLNSSLG